MDGYPNWVKLDNHGLVYFYNKETMETAWTLGDGAVTASS